MTCTKHEQLPPMSQQRRQLLKGRIAGTSASSLVSVASAAATIHANSSQELSVRQFYLGASMSDAVDAAVTRRRWQARCAHPSNAPNESAVATSASEASVAFAAHSPLRPPRATVAAVDEVDTTVQTVGAAVDKRQTVAVSGLFAIGQGRVRVSEQLPAHGMNIEALLFAQQAAAKAAEAFDAVVNEAEEIVALQAYAEQQERQNAALLGRRPRIGANADDDGSAAVARAMRFRDASKEQGVCTLAEFTEAFRERQGDRTVQQPAAPIVEQPGRGAPPRGRLGRRTGITTERAEQRG
jgi:hypothetical protein